MKNKFVGIAKVGEKGQIVICKGVVQWLLKKLWKKDIW